MKKLSLFVMLIIAIISNSHATIKFVNINAVGANNGTSWINAYTDLQSALTNSISGDSIWVANGIYIPPTNFPARAASFKITHDITAFGGFNGTESLLSQRDFSSFMTVLSGDIGILGSADDNCGNILKISNAGAFTRLDGFKITKANGTQPPLSAGYFVDPNALIIDHSSPTIINCLFTDNQAGSVIFYSGSTANNANIKQCAFKDNNPYGPLFSGGNLVGIIKVQDSGTVNVEDCEISSNGSSSGVFYLAGTPATTNVNRCKISNNNSGITYINGGRASFNMYNSLIVGNKATGCAFMFATSTIIDSLSQQNIVNCTISDNKSGVNLFGFMMLTSKTKMNNNIIWGNVGGIAQYDNTNANHAVFSSNIIQGGVPVFFQSTSTNTSIQDPLFISQGSSTLAPFNANNYNYQVSYTSPALDMGSNMALPAAYNRDLNDTLRPQGANVDIGCFEKAVCQLNTGLLLPHGDTSICQGYSVNVVASGGNAYIWNTGASSPALTLDTSGTYIVNISDSVSHCSTKDTILLTVNALPIPVITASVNGLSTATFSSYQWLLNNNPISGATSQDYMPTAQGSYRVYVTNSSGCADTSAAYSFTATAINNVSDSQNVTIYPNPVKEQIVIQWKSAAPKNAFIHISNVLGQNVFETSLIPNSNKIALSVNDLVSATYFIAIYNEKHELVVKTKFVKH